MKNKDLKMLFIVMVPIVIVILFFLILRQFAAKIFPYGNSYYEFLYSSYAVTGAILLFFGVTLLAKTKGRRKMWSLPVILLALFLLASWLLYGVLDDIRF